MEALKILKAGPGTTFQDAGRLHWRRFGVTPAGPMDWAAFRAANKGLGNAGDAAAIEIAMGGLEAECLAEQLDIAFCGGDFRWSRNDEALASAMCLRLRRGDVLKVRLGASGAFTYLAVAGGFAVPLEMGSRSSHLRSGIGAPALKDGDLCSVLGGTVAEAREGILGVKPGQAKQAPIRVVLGPQDDYFTPEAIATFFAEPFVLTASADRMAYRFSGPQIAHKAGFNIVSDGIALGAIQVGGDGQPLILMADHQPTGGYPKLGTVIRADIGRLAQVRPGESCRFAPTTLAEARAALFALEDEIAAVTFKKPAAAMSNEALRRINLIDGVIRAD